MNLILTVTDLKQYCYCPRILFYMRCLPGVRPLTVKMEEGRGRRSARSPSPGGGS